MTRRDVFLVVALVTLAFFNVYVTGTIPDLLARSMVAFAIAFFGSWTLVDVAWNLFPDRRATESNDT